MSKPPIYSVAVKVRRPFGIDAWVVLPDHIPAVWTLQEVGDIRHSF